MMAIKDWNNLTPEDWDEIIGGIKQFEKDFPPKVEKVELSEEQMEKVRQQVEAAKKRIQERQKEK